MIVYHTSNVAISHPDIDHSRLYLDFGKGFYVTTLREQALKYSARIIARGATPIINTYEFSCDYNNIRHKRFESYNEDWLDYVAACRDGQTVEKYDVIEGGVANDKVFETIDLYFAGNMSKEDALRKLVYLKPNWQICITSQEILDNCLKIINSEVIK